MNLYICVCVCVCVWQCDMMGDVCTRVFVCVCIEFACDVYSRCAHMHVHMRHSYTWEECFYTEKCYGLTTVGLACSFPLSHGFLVTSSLQNSSSNCPISTLMTWRAVLPHLCQTEFEVRAAFLGTLVQFTLRICF